MRILALITARGGSKRVVGKNIRHLGEKPLVVWSIDVAKDISDICDILVSTDEPEIGQVSKESGVLVPWLRPAELSTDEATSVDVALHALDWYESINGSVDGLLLLQPTSPFRTKETVCKGIALFKKNPKFPVLSVSLAHTHPMKILKRDGEYLKPYLDEHGFGKRSQDLPEVYEENGCLYLISPKQLRATRSFIGPTAQPLFITSEVEALDIDTEADWGIATKIINEGGMSRLSCTNSVPRTVNHSSQATASYLSENEIIFSLEQKTLVHMESPRSVEIGNLRGIFKRKVKNLTLDAALYMRELIQGFGEIKKLSHIKGSKKGKKAIVIGNGPSQGLIGPEILRKFKENGNDTFSVNFWHQNIDLAIVPPEYLIISDPRTLADPKSNKSESVEVLKANSDLMDYLKANVKIILVTPLCRTKYFKGIFGEERVLGFVDSEMRWLSSNIDPRLPRGYLSMTLFKALAFAIHLGYEQIYLVGMDNTYPRDVFCDKNNHILHHERHAGATDYLIDVTSQIPTMDVWAQDIFQLFHDLRRCFVGSQVINLDCYSLTDVFTKISNVNQIDLLLGE